MLNYIERNVPAGVGIEVKSFKLVRFPKEIRVSENERVRVNKRPIFSNMLYFTESRLLLKKCSA